MGEYPSKQVAQSFPHAKEPEVNPEATAGGVADM